MAINKRFIIGIDIGGSKINTVLFENGKILKSEKIPTPKNKKKLLKYLNAVIEKIISGTNKKELTGIGCGIAGMLDLKKGAVLNAPNLRFLNNLNIKNWLEKKFKCNVKIDNDARCFTRAEYLYGSGREYKNLIGITLGTGIGGGIIINGKIFYGASDAAGELGHMVIDRSKDLEAMTVKQARKLKFSRIAVGELKKNLGIGLANIVNILDLEAIIIGGGLAADMKFILPAAEKTMRRFIISPKSRKNVKIIIGKLGENASAIGAAALFMEPEMRNMKHKI